MEDEHEGAFQFTGCILAVIAAVLSAYWTWQATQHLCHGLTGARGWLIAIAVYCFIEPFMFMGVFFPAAGVAGIVAALLPKKHV